MREQFELLLISNGQHYLSIYTFYSVEEAKEYAENHARMYSIQNTLEYHIFPKVLKSR